MLRRWDGPGRRRFADRPAEDEAGRARIRLWLTVEPRWRGFERILAHAYPTWTSLPQHESPIFARDNFRCQVPGCSRRGRLHRYHAWFRSQGGPDWAWNLACVCNEHHDDFIHLGRVHVEGCAPDGLV